MNRFFRITSAAMYDQVRLSLDTAWGHVAPETCVDPAAVAPVDVSGNILLAVRQEFCEFAAVAQMLPQLLASGVVEEIDEQTYRTSIAAPTSPIG